MNKKRSGAVLEKNLPVIAKWLPKTTTYMGYTLLTNPATAENNKKKNTHSKEFYKKHPRPKLSDLGSKLSKKTGSGVFTITNDCRGFIGNFVNRIKKSILGLRVAGKGKGGSELTSGMLNIMLAFTRCEDVDIYGFGVGGGQKIKGVDSKFYVNKTEMVSDRMSRFHNWALEQAVIRYLVAGGGVDLC